MAHVMDIAAGNGQATGRPGVAPAADLIFVHIYGGDVAREDSGNLRTLLEAVDYLYEGSRTWQVCGGEPEPGYSWRTA